MKVPFVKMHGSANDFILVDEWAEELIPEDQKSDFVLKASDRSTGVGSEGVIFVQKSRSNDAKFVFYNPDGRPAEMSGNGIRCFAKYLYDGRHTSKTNFNVETMVGVKNIQLTLFNDKVDHVRVDMGGAQLSRGEIGISGSSLDKFIDKEDVVDAGVSYRVTCVGIGNPHAVIFVDDVESINVDLLGGKIRNMTSLFTKGVNVHFVVREGKNRFKVRSFERGVEHETPACGTGVCACAVAAVLNSLADASKMFKFQTRGGELLVELKAAGERIDKIFLVGPSVESFRGVMEYDPSEKFQNAAYHFIDRVIHPKPT